MGNNWGIKYHVQSSMNNAEDGFHGFHCFLGRFQPLHVGHQELFAQQLDKGRNICIMIRDVEPSEKNPYTAEQVKENIESFYKEFVWTGRVKVMIVPNIVSINFGRGVGYDIIEHIPPTEIADISATKIREQNKTNGII